MEALINEFLIHQRGMISEGFYIRLIKIIATQDPWNLALLVMCGLVEKHLETNDTLADQSFI